jgi:hypothetical protein
VQPHTLGDSLHESCEADFVIDDKARTGSSNHGFLIFKGMTLFLQGNPCDSVRLERGRSASSFGLDLNAAIVGYKVCAAHRECVLDLARKTLACPAPRRGESARLFLGGEVASFGRNRS